MSVEPFTFVVEVDCVPGDLVEVIKLDDDGHQDEDAWLNNSDNDDDVRPGRVEAGSGFGGTRLGGGGGGSSRAAPASSPALNGNGRRSESVTAASSSKEEEWEVIPSDGDVPMADPVGEENRMKSCPTCSKFRRHVYLCPLSVLISELTSLACFPLSAFANSASFQTLHSRIADDPALTARPLPFQPLLHL